MCQTFAENFDDPQCSKSDRSSSKPTRKLVLIHGVFGHQTTAYVIELCIARYFLQMEDWDQDCHTKCVNDQNLGTSKRYQGSAPCVQRRRRGEEDGKPKPSKTKNSRNTGVGLMTTNGRLNGMKSAEIVPIGCWQLIRKDDCIYT